MFHTSQFDVDNDYYWPAASYFGADWFHVRRLPPDSWMGMHDAAGEFTSDLLLGSAVSLTLKETAA